MKIYFVPGWIAVMTFFVLWITACEAPQQVQCNRDPDQEDINPTQVECMEHPPSSRWADNAGGGWVFYNSYGYRYSDGNGVVSTVRRSGGTFNSYLSPTRSRVAAPTGGSRSGGARVGTTTGRSGFGSFGGGRAGG